MRSVQDLSRECLEKKACIKFAFLLKAPKVLTRNIMISFRYPEERDIVFYYAGKLSDHTAARIFVNEIVIDESAALHISEFFWAMVDSSINCTKEKTYPWADGAEFWNENILNSLSGSLERLGFIEIWDGVVDKQ